MWNWKKSNVKLNRHSMWNWIEVKCKIECGIECQIECEIE